MIGPRQLYAGGFLLAGGASPQAGKWDLTSLPGYDPRRRWAVWRCGYLPPAAYAGPAIFQLQADGLSSPTYILGGDNQGMQQIDTLWPLPPNWSGRIRWSPGGQLLVGTDAESTYGTGTWLIATAVFVWLQLIELQEESAGSYSGC